MKQILASFAALALLLGGCQNTPQTPEAVAYDTLRQAQNIVKAKHDLFEAKVAQGGVPVEREREVRTAYVQAERAIAAAARTGAALGLTDAGFSATTPEQTRALVDAFLKLVAQIAPPNN